MKSAKILHIGIDGNEANVVKRVGSNQYAYGLLKALAAIDAPNVRFTIYLKSKPVADMPAKTSTWRYRVLPPGKFWTQWRLPLDLYLNPNRPDVFLSPGHYAPRFSPVKTVVTIMDLAFLHLPDQFLPFKRGAAQLVEWTKYSVEKASHVFAISEHTKKDVITTYHRDPTDVTVIYPGVELTHYKPTSKNEITVIQQKYHLSPDYLLYLGTIQPRKNLIRLIKAFEKLPSKFSKTQLVLAGQIGWMVEDFEEAVVHSPAKDRIIRLGFVPDCDVAALYSGSKAVCLVGLYEGFGMPPAEALACGALPVVSNSTSLPEVVGEGAILVDPYSVASITHGLTAALTLSVDRRQAIINKGQAHIKQFTWGQSAAKVMEVLHAIALR